MRFLFPLLVLALLTTCRDDGATNATRTDNPTPMPSPTVIKADFGTANGQPVDLFTLTNSAGNRVKITNYGGIITSLTYDGAEMVIGYDVLKRYLDPNPYFGALVGRYGNRIGDARFTLDGTTYPLPANNNGNQLHGGPEGFDKKVWTATTGTTTDAAFLSISHVSPDGDMGFPGELTVRCTYTWTNENELRLEYEATTTRNTIVNLTNHSYFNLGDGPTITDHLLTIAADSYTPTDEELIPLGENAPVAGTPFDFRRPKAVGQDIDADHPQLAIPGGYDHNFALNGYDGSLREFALVEDPASGRRMRCFTTEPGVQLWTSNFDTGQFSARGGKDFPARGALCLETQHFPDSPNQAAFKTPRLNTGEVYRTTTVYRFEKN